jgi:hypothetical protein
MPRTGRMPSIVPYGADQTVYSVVDRCGGLGSSFPGEAEIERADLESVLSDLMWRQFNDPLRIIAFNTLEHWSEDISADIAQEIQTRCDIEGEDVPEHIQDFVKGYGDRARLQF